MRRPLLLLALLALGACRLGADAGGPPALDPQSLAAPPVEVTTLTDPAPAAVPPAPGPESAPETTAEPPPAVVSPSQLACEKAGGSYVAVKALFTCVKTPPDAGRRCARESDCSGRCLARSQTCAPLDPLLGCNDILDDEGRRITLCLD
ncbi:hypothetical protein EBL87_05545 [Cereibacter sphaeroides]|uniref:hypothetical protein n=1 Tax=Cereibacter sphaeroides TaxID=1063 RepID=UPI000F549304|nr:hypothetical protein [Cereibacter sphaeroides]AZB63214.1 hypothetical protein EBL87_05545 [Cereibacter sphaeroides]AZB68869.1 hypothetical protein EBL86_10920 [Cereibacter sphaeroides]